MIGPIRPIRGHRPSPSRALQFDWSTNFPDWEPFDGPLTFYPTHLEGCRVRGVTPYTQPGTMNIRQSIILLATLFTIEIGAVAEHPVPVQPGQAAAFRAIKANAIKRAVSAPAKLASDQHSVAPRRVQSAPAKFSSTGTGTPRAPVQAPVAAAPVEGTGANPAPAPVQVIGGVAPAPAPAFAPVQMIGGVDVAAAEWETGVDVAPAPASAPVQVIRGADVAPAPVQVIGGADVAPAPAPAPVQVIGGADVAPAPIQMSGGTGPVPAPGPAPVQVIGAVDPAPVPAPVSGNKIPPPPGPAPGPKKRDPAPIPVPVKPAAPKTAGQFVPTQAEIETQIRKLNHIDDKVRIPPKPADIPNEPNKPTVADLQKVQLNPVPDTQKNLLGKKIAAENATKAQLIKKTLVPGAQKDGRTDFRHRHIHRHYHYIVNA